MGSVDRAAAPDRGLWDRAAPTIRAAAEQRDSDLQQWHDQYAPRADKSEQRSRDTARGGGSYASLADPRS